ncbi:MAG: 30S ribosomal protein S4 [Nanoarchaeota archaeon]|nr:30S ribosomal protein S4 [Nanoarchaeota archaeon]
MGDPRKQRKKYSTPSHPWQKARIDEEKILVVEYGLKNKKDLWRMISKLAKFKQQAKALIARKDSQALKEKELFIIKLQKLNLVNENSSLEDVLDLAVKDLLERRLQTILFRKGYARTIKQSRQMITHQHIMINGQKMDVPSFLVPTSIEAALEFQGRSPFADPEHPERKDKEKAPKIEEKEEAKIENTPKEKIEEVVEVAANE